MPSGPGPFGRWKVRTVSPLVRSQTRTALSREAVTTKRPSGVKAARLTMALCPAASRTNTGRSETAGSGVDGPGVTVGAVVAGAGSADGVGVGGGTGRAGVVV